MKRLLFISLLALSLSGCLDKLTGAANRDAEAMGFACRISQKLPEQCIKDYPNYAPTSILAGWKAGDAEMKDKNYGGAMRPAGATMAQPAPADDGAEAPAPAEGKKETSGNPPP